MTISKILLLTLLINTFGYKAYSESTCDIYIPGVSTEINYFHQAPRNVDWDTTLPLEEAAITLAQHTLDSIASCPDEQPVLLKSQNYGVTVLYYILGAGRRFAKLFPDHNFVKLFRKVTAVYSYGGSFNGTPLMDKICSDGEYQNITEALGSTCILSLSTSVLHHPTKIVGPPGVPFYLIYSTKSTGILGDTLATENYNPSSQKEIINNLNDGLFPLSSTKGCSDLINMTANNDCEKIDPTFIIDYKHIEDSNHLEMANDLDLLTIEDRP